MPDTLRPEDVKYIIVHDTGVAVDQSAATIDAYHRSRGYDQIGYHWLVRQNGDLEPGRPENLVGAHTQGDTNIPSPNRQSIGIAMTGDRSLEGATQAQRDALVDKIAQLCIKYNVPVENVRGHGEVEPGNSDFPSAQMNQLRPLVEARIAAIRQEQANVQTPPSPTTTPDATTNQTTPNPTTPNPTTPGAITPPPTTPGTTTGAVTPDPPDLTTAVNNGGITRDLRRGDTGPEVRILQSHLLKEGTNNLGRTGRNGDGIDGDFGPLTQAAVREFQQANNLPVTGVVDQVTRAALPVLVTASGQTPTTPGATTPPNSSPGNTTLTRDLQRGSIGTDVRTLQRHLLQAGATGLGTTGRNGDGIDGDFGPLTQAAVRQFQQDNGLPVTGVVDRATRAALPALVTAPTTPSATTTTPGQPTTQPTPSGDGATTPLPLQTPPGQTPPGQTTTPPGRLDDPSAVFLREADTLIANVLDRHTGNVPGALDALVVASRGLGSGPLGATTPEDVQRAFDRFSAGDSTARPLSRAEAAAIAPVLDARTRLIAEGTQSAPSVTPSGDGAGRTTPEPTLTTSGETTPARTQLPTETGPQL